MLERVLPKDCPNCDIYTRLAPTPVGGGRMAIICDECGREGPAAGDYIAIGQYETARMAIIAWNNMA